MRIALYTILCIVFSTSLGAADKKPAKEPKESAVQKAAKAWLKLVIDSKDTPPADAKKAVAYFASVPTVDECKKVESGSATTAAVMTQLKACVTAAHKHFGKPDLASVAVNEIKLEKFLSHFDDATLKKKLKTLATGLSLTLSAFDGDGENLVVYVGMGSDNSVRLVVLDSNPVD